MKATHFHIRHQAREGALWRTLVQASGTPLALPLELTHQDFLEVASRAGSYLLVPVDATGVQRGDPPQQLHLRVDAASALPAAASPRDASIEARDAIIEGAPTPPDEE